MPEPRDHKTYVGKLRSVQKCACQLATLSLSDKTFNPNFDSSVNKNRVLTHRSKARLI